MVDVERLPDVAMATLRGDAAAGLPAVGTSTLRDGDRCIAIGPEEWLVVAADSDADALLLRIATAAGTAIDVSGNRVRFRVAGPQALDLLAAGCALDLERLPPGAAVSTLIGRVPAVVVVEARDAFLALPRRSFAAHFASWACAAASDIR